ncbi:MAG: MFS transporter [Chloroflexota bacterium]
MKTHRPALAGHSKQDPSSMGSSRTSAITNQYAGVTNRVLEPVMTAASSAASAISSTIATPVTASATASATVSAGTGSYRQQQAQPLPRQTQPAAPASTARTAALRRILIGLMIPTAMTTLNMSMFSVALPEIRNAFAAQPDLVAWIVTAYSLPYVIFMPLYGRLSDGLGKVRLFQCSIILFFIGSLVCLFSQNLPTLLLGRALQGMGTSGINPLCMAIISDVFPSSERGKAMGTWSSMAPGAAVIAPIFAGYLLSAVGDWRMIFIPALVTAVIAYILVQRQLAELGSVSKAESVTKTTESRAFLKEFDWIGLTLMFTTLITFMFYLSSRVVTGVEPLRDWRLFLGTVVLGALFLSWERHYQAQGSTPLVNLQLYIHKNFGMASIAAFMRMFIMGGFGMLKVLYLTDIYHISPSTLGFTSAIYAFAIFATVRFGGQMADRWNPRWIVLTGMGIQISIIFVLAAFDNITLWWAVAFFGMQALGAGLALASLHRAALGNIPSEENGGAAGLYSMTRFGGSIVGATLAGVVLQQALLTMNTLDAYQTTFAFIGIVSMSSFYVIARLRK